MNVHDDIPSLMKERVLHLIELHFFMEGMLEVGVFDLRTGSQVKRGDKETGERGLAWSLGFFQWPRRFSLSPRSIWVACVQTPPPSPPSPSAILLRGRGSVHRLHLGACLQTNRKGAPFL